MQSLLLRNRWIAAIGAVSIQLALGVIYAWSVFTVLLEKPLDQGGVYGFSTTQTFIVFATGLCAFAIVMVWAGRLLGAIGPRRLTILSGVGMGAGYVFAGIYGDTFAMQLVGIGLIAGSATGLGYVVPLAMATNWFPDRKGDFSGIAVMGFGAGAVLWIKLGDTIGGGLLNTISIAGLPGVQSVFIVYGVALFALILFGSLFMVNPPEDYPIKAPTGSAGSTNLSTREMLCTWQYYALTGFFFLSALPGLMVIVSVKLFGKDVLPMVGIVDTVVVTGTAGAILAVGNSLGRIFWGALSDRLGRGRSMAVMALLQGVTMLASYHIVVTNFGLDGFYAVAFFVGFNFGGNFALVPTQTSDLFGNKTFGRNFPLVFLAYGPAGIAGAYLAGYFRDLAQGSGDPHVWMAPYIVGGVACIIAAGLALALRPVSAKQQARFQPAPSLA